MSGQMSGQGNGLELTLVGADVLRPDGLETAGELAIGGGPDSGWARGAHG